ncbi:MAG: hypothetical protein ACPGQS_06015, partial [Bradymonadia bacterium]
VRSARAPSDGLTWMPFYFEEGSRLFEGLNAFEMPDWSIRDLSRYERVWVIAADHSELEDVGGDLVVEAVHRVGPLTVWRVDNRGERVVADLYDDLKAAKVSEVGGRDCDFWAVDGWHCLAESRRPKTERCLAESTQKRLSRFKRRRDPHCGLSPWFHVSQDVRVIDRFARRCVWIHPRRQKPFRVTWSPGVSFDHVVIKYGFTDRVISMHSRPRPRTHAARLLLSQGERTQEINIQPVQGWFERRIPAAAPSKDGPIVLELTTDNPVDGHFCVDLTVRKRGMHDGS